MKIFIFAALCFVFFSCETDRKDYTEKFEKLAGLVNNYPDSALSLLYLIDPETLDESQHAEYVLIEIQAKHKNGLDISGETTIFDAVSYFLGKKDVEKAAQAYYYSGRVYNERGDNERAMKNYLKAKGLSKNIKNNQLKGAIIFGIGYLHYFELNYDLAISSGSPISF